MHFRASLVNNTLHAPPPLDTTTRGMPGTFYLIAVQPLISFLSSPALLPSTQQAQARRSTPPLAMITRHLY
jgi:hypothetical protein